MNYKLRGVEIVGIEKVAEPETIFNFLVLIRAQYGMPLPKKIVFRKMRVHYGFGSYAGNWMSIMESVSIEHMKFVIVHELVHCNGIRGHKNNFWRRFLSYCKTLNLEPKDYLLHSVYKRGHEYYLQHIGQAEPLNRQKEVDRKLILKIRC